MPTTKTSGTSGAPWADDTRDRILDAAERLFADHGIEGVSLRQITREAGVNIAAIHYHYGSRDGLVRAVLDRVILPLNKMRLEMLDDVLRAAGGRPLALDTILDCYIRPDLVTIEHLRDRGPSVARFIGRTYNQPTPLVQVLMREQFAEVGDRFFRELHRTLPHLSLEEIGWRMNWCVVGVIVALFSQATPRGEEGPFDTSDIGATLARIVAFVGPGLSAPAVGRGHRRQRKGGPSRKKTS